MSDQRSLLKRLTVFGIIFLCISICYLQNQESSLSKAKKKNDMEERIDHILLENFSHQNDLEGYRPKKNAHIFSYDDYGLIYLDKKLITEDATLIFYELILDKDIDLHPVDFYNSFIEKMGDQEIFDDQFIVNTLYSDEEPMQLDYLENVIQFSDPGDHKSWLEIIRENPNQISTSQFWYQGDRLNEFEMDVLRKVVESKPLNYWQNQTQLQTAFFQQLVVARQKQTKVQQIGGFYFIFGYEINAKQADLLRKQGPLAIESDGFTYYLDNTVITEDLAEQILNNYGQKYVDGQESTPEDYSFLSLIDFINEIQQADDKDEGITDLQSMEETNEQQSEVGSVDQTDSEEEVEKVQELFFLQQGDEFYIGGVKLNSFETDVIQTAINNKSLVDKETYLKQLNIRKSKQNKVEQIKGDYYVFGYLLTQKQAQILQAVGPQAVSVKKNKYFIGSESISEELGKLILDNYDYKYLNQLEQTDEQKEREKQMYALLQKPNALLQPQNQTIIKEKQKFKDGDLQLVDLENIPEDADDYMYYGSNHKEEKRKHYEKINKKIKEQRKQKRKQITEMKAEYIEKELLFEKNRKKNGFSPKTESKRQFLFSKSEWEQVQSQAQKKILKRRQGMN